MKVTFEIPKPQPTHDTFLAEFAYVTEYKGTVTAAFTYLAGARTHKATHCDTCTIRNLKSGEIVP